MPHWERGDVANLSLVAPAGFGDTKLSILALGGSVPTPKDGVRGELIEVKSIDELKMIGEGVRGKIVLFNRPLDPTIIDTFNAYGRALDQRRIGACEAGKLGAVAAIVRSLTNRIDDVPHTGMTRYEAGSPRIPAVAISTAGAEKQIGRAHV